jgi:hypothetical protein
MQTCDFTKAWDLVLADIAKHNKAEYNTRLQPFNGRDRLQDVYEEALDLLVHLRLCIYERDTAQSTTPKVHSVTPDEAVKIAHKIAVKHGLENSEQLYPPVVICQQLSQRIQENDLELEQAFKRENSALKIALEFGGCDGADHKMWVIDQVIRALVGGGYDKIITEVKNGKDGPNTYDWDTGVAP